MKIILYKGDKILWPPCRIDSHPRLNPLHQLFSEIYLIFWEYFLICFLYSIETEKHWSTRALAITFIRRMNPQFWLVWRSEWHEKKNHARQMNTSVADVSTVHFDVYIRLYLKKKMLQSMWRAGWYINKISVNGSEEAVSVTISPPKQV